MSITITRSIDVEDAVRAALTDHITTYCRPLPENFTVPCLLVQATGGSSEATASGIGKIDTFMVVIDSRAVEEDVALRNLRNAVAIIEKYRPIGVSYVAVNSLYSWGVDPARPDLTMCSVSLMVTAHRETVTI